VIAAEISFAAKEVGELKAKLSAEMSSLSGADLWIYELAPALIEARRKSLCSLKVNTTIAIVLEMERTHVTISRPFPSGKLISTTIPSGAIFVIWAIASNLEAASNV
jgi:hypothetical protein